MSGIYQLLGEALGRAVASGTPASGGAHLAEELLTAAVLSGNVDHEPLRGPIGDCVLEVVRTVPLSRASALRISPATSLLELLHSLYDDPRFRDEVHARTLVDWPVELVLRTTARPPHPLRLNGPVLSLLCDAQGATPEEIERLIASLRVQSHPRWELCLCDAEDASTLAKYAVDRHRGSDPRLRFLRLPQRCAHADAVDRTAELMTGDLVGVVGMGDELTPDALAYMVQALGGSPGAELLYSDEEVRTPLGLAALRKPGWSPDLQLCRPYLGRLTLMRTELWLELGGLDARYAGAEEEALMLRAAGKAHVVHVQQVTCRSDPRVTNGAALKAAVTDTVRDLDADARVSGGLLGAGFRVDWASPPSRGQVTVVTVGGNPNTEAMALARRGSAEDRRVVRRLHMPAMDGEGLNEILRGLTTEDVVLLHPGEASLAEDWVEVLTGHARQLGVGLAAAARPRLAGSGDDAVPTWLVLNDEVPAWPGAVATRRSLLRWMGGFAGSQDVGAALADLSSRLRRQGFRTVHTPYAIQPP